MPASAAPQPSQQPPAQAASATAATTSRGAAPRALSLAAVLGIALPAVAVATEPVAAAPQQSDMYEGHVQVDRGKAADAKKIQGAVFDDKNHNSKKDKGEKPVVGASVSNGKEIVKTDAQGHYTLPVRDDMTVFVTQPRGWQVPVDENKFAQFSYTHSPKGTPGDLKYGGLKPTGDLPKAVNFPMVKSKATASDKQNCPIAADTQSYNEREIGYARDGAAADLAKRHDYPGCGIMLLGDNVGDDLSLFPQLKNIYSNSNGPIRAVPGNHDIDYDATGDEHSTDSYKQAFGPTYYSYDVGSTHFVALDSISYEGGHKYKEAISKEQIAWLKQDLKNVAPNQQIVINTHAPIVNYWEAVVDNAPELYSVLKNHPNVTTVGGHTHTLENLRKGSQRAEWKEAGIDKLPATQLVAGAVSGDWYSGDLNGNGLPYAYTADGAEPGVMTLKFDGAKQSEFYTVRNEARKHQLMLGVNSPTWRNWAEKAKKWQEDKKKDPKKAGDAPKLDDGRSLSQADLKTGKSYATASFYAGSRDAHVEVSVDGKSPQGAEHTQPAKGEALRRAWDVTEPTTATHNLKTSGNVDQSSSHLWRAALPKNLNPGTHSAEFTATDRYGKQYTQTVRFTVTEGGKAVADPADAKGATSRAGSTQKQRPADNGELSAYRD